MTVMMVVVMMMMTSLFQRVYDLETELSSKSQQISRLNSELAELKDETLNATELRRSVRELQQQLRIAKDAADVTQQKNVELKQTVKNRDKQLEVNDNYF